MYGVPEDRGAVSHLNGLFERPRGGFASSTSRRCPLFCGNSIRPSGAHRQPAHRRAALLSCYGLSLLSSDLNCFAPGSGILPMACRYMYRVLFFGVHEKRRTWWAVGSWRPGPRQTNSCEWCSLNTHSQLIQDSVFFSRFFL